MEEYLHSYKSACTAQYLLSDSIRGGEGYYIFRRWRFGINEFLKLFLMDMYARRVVVVNRSANCSRIMRIHA